MKIISHTPFVRAESINPHAFCQGNHSERQTKSMRNRPILKHAPPPKGVSTYICHIIQHLYYTSEHDNGARANPENATKLIQTSKRITAPRRPRK